MAKDGFYISRRMVKSKVFRSLSGRAILVYLEFRMKCKVDELKTQSGRMKEWFIKNNGELEFTYIEAEKKGFTRPRFVKAIDELINKGFLYIEHQGLGGVKGDKTKYGISDRWEKYGTDDFEEMSRPKDARKGRGFAVYWKRKKFNHG